MRNKKQLTYQAWPTADPNAVAEETFNLVFCINGKRISQATVATNIADDEAKTLFLEDPKIIKMLANRSVKKLIVVRQKLINAVD